MKFYVMLTMTLMLGGASFNGAIAQKRAISLATTYPVLIGDTFLSDYGGSLGAAATIDFPIGGNLRFRPSFRYERLRIGENDGRTSGIVQQRINGSVYTAHVALGYIVDLAPKLVVTPEVGMGIVRLKQ